MEPNFTNGSTPTIYDVAALASVSIATVSRVLNDRDNQRPDTRDRVLRAMKDLHYVPNGAARQLSTRVKRVIALAFVRPPFGGIDDEEGRDIDEPTDALCEVEANLLFTDAVIRGAEYTAQVRGYSLLLQGMPASDSPGISSLAGKADGLIALDRVIPFRRIPALAARIPLVLLAGSGRSRSAVTVRVDNEGAMTALAEHFVRSHGARRLAFLAGMADSPDSFTRLNAFRASAASLGASIEDDADCWFADWTISGAVRAVELRLTRKVPLPDAIACANDQMCVGVIYALRRAGIGVPNDVMVSGFDDVPMARHLSPALTTVRQPAQRLGSVAVETLLSLIEDPTSRPKSVVLPTRLVIRETCGCAAVAAVARGQPAQLASRQGPPSPTPPLYQASNPQRLATID